MTPPTLACARALRDGGIDAVAALDFALAAALAGLSDKEARELKGTFGSLMGEVIDKTINPAVQAFPELAPDIATWSDIARELAARRGMGPG